MEEAVAVVAAHLGCADENLINNMSIVFFNDVLAAIGKKLNYESISNLYGNSFAKNAQKYISAAYPLLHKSKTGAAAFAASFNKSKIKKISMDTEAGKELAKSLLGDEFGDALN